MRAHFPEQRLVIEPIRHKDGFFCLQVDGTITGGKKERKLRDFQFSYDLF